jgi:hypothetical protein
MDVRGLVAAACCVLAVSSISYAALASPAVEPCLEQGGGSIVGKAVKETFGPSPLARYDNIVADARGVAWRPSAPLAGSGTARYAAAFDGTNNCWLGGNITGTGEDGRRAPSGLAVGTAYPTSRTEIHSLEISGTLNGVRVGPLTSDLRLTNILLSESTDTCLVADQRGDLLVDHVLFERCARVIRLQSQSAGGTLTIRNVLIEIDSRPETRNRGQIFNRGALRSDMEVNFHNNIIATEKTLDSHSLAVIAANCSNNTLIWLGQGDYPGDLPACFEVSSDRGAWDAAKLAWMDQFQPQPAALRTTSVAAAAACTLPSVPTSISPTKRVGNGSPGSCTESALRNALTGGGTITFSCGSAAVNIPIRSELTVASRTVLDGGGRVSLDGQNRTRIILNRSQLTLQRITSARSRTNWTLNRLVLPCLCPRARLSQSMKTARRRSPDREGLRLIGFLLSGQKAASPTGGSLGS